MKAVGDKRGDVQALFDTLADPIAEVDAVTVGDTQGDAHAVVDTVADTLQEAVVEAIRLHTGRSARTNRPSA